ncbi:MAG TPA: dihydroorotate dehydrogenase (quinone), partial [Burkholderiaceae bacterium]|nr:dihydroorotate dehydrogenase (quinone) [Burkholderiaceae bacterium]
MFPSPYALARPLLFAIDPERAHDLTLASLDALAAGGALRVAAGCPVDDPVELLGLRFANRVGLAAGLDKNGAHVDALAAMGFGFVEVGTVTPKPQPGNPKPRMFRLPEADALINRMGFNNLGLDAFVSNVQRRRSQGVLGLNIVKNAATPIERATDDYLEGLRRVWPHASYVTVNVSSPNTKGLRQRQGGDELTAMLAALGRERTALRRSTKREVPMLVKIAPDLDDAQIDAIAGVLVAQSVDGVIATNTTVSRDA